MVRVYPIAAWLDAYWAQFLRLTPALAPFDTRSTPAYNAICLANRHL